jgi:DNA-binding beta-propeller fold protein YncE
MFALGRINRMSSIATLPLMVLVIVMLGRLNFDHSPAPLPASGMLAVASLRGESLGFHDFAANGAEKRLALAGPPHELALADGRLYATLGRGNQVVEIDPHAPGVMRTLTLTGEPHGLAIAEDNLLVTLDAGDALVTVSREGFDERGRTPTGDTPHTVAAAGSEVYVTDSRANQLRLMGESPVLADTGRLPESVAIAGGYVVTADAESGSVSVYRRGSLELAGRISTGGHPVRVVALDETHVAVALNEASSVAVIDLGTMRVVRHKNVLGHPDGICASPDGAYVAVVSNATDSVQVFRASDWRLAATLATGDGPGACAWVP